MLCWVDKCVPLLLYTLDTRTSSTCGTLLCIATRVNTRAPAAGRLAIQTNPNLHAAI
jgi:hypothetical protein